MFLAVAQVQGQIKDIGLPFVDNYMREEYNAGTQNWSVTQDEIGRMYFGNNEGVLRFDGTDWELFPLPNSSIVRSVNWIGGRLYAGGFEEFGYFQIDEKGDFIYQSLSDSLEATHRSFGEVWRIFSTDHGLVFQSFLRIFVIQDGEMEVYAPGSRYGFSYFADNNLFVVDRDFGLSILTANGPFPVYTNSDFFRENEITFILSAGGNEYLLGTTMNGIFRFDGNKLQPWEAPVNEDLIRAQIYSGLKINEEQIAVGTIRDGVYILDIEGNTALHMNRAQGLQNNTVLSMFPDRYGNLWLGMDNGIDVLEISSPFSQLYHYHGIETAYVSLVHEGVLYVGTNQGLFARPFSRLSNRFLGDVMFRKVEGIVGQVWTLREFRGSLFCGTNLGTFLVEDYGSEQISDRQGGWTYVRVPGSENLVIGGTYTGLQLFEYSSGAPAGWRLRADIGKFSESCKEIMFDEEDRLWMTHNYRGIFRLGLSDDMESVDSVRIYDNSRGLPAKPYSMSWIDGEMYILAADGFYTYDGARDSFHLENEYGKWLDGGGNLTRVMEDQMEDLWFFSSEELGVLRKQEDGTYLKMEKPFRRIHGKFLRSSFENVYVYDRSNVFIGGERGLLHYDPEKEKDFDQEFSVFIRTMILKGRQMDSVIYHREEAGKEYQVAFRYNSTVFNFFSTYYEDRGNVSYSCRLEGIDEDWLPWQDNNFKEYTNLREGEYRFYVRAMNVHGKVSKPAAVSFRIAPPFYRTRLAYALYLGLILIITGVVILIIRRRVTRAQQIEKEKHARQMEAREASYREGEKLSNQEIERLKNEQLLLEMRHKTMELANSTMYLVQKNKFLNRIKGDINELSGRLVKESNKHALRQIVHRIDRDIKSKQHWKLFDEYFDEVHEDFLNRLKEMHPDLTPKDLRLCAYLKMNISTKEIAPLMNISVRGVEISRYRLRKKLGLEAGANLTEYILSV